MNKNVNVKNEVAVIEPKKPVARNRKKVEPTTTPVATTKIAVVENATPVVKNTDISNKSVKNVILSFDETMSLMSEYGIGSKSHTKQYRIMNGGSSIHVLKTKYRIYMTTIDFELCGKLKTSDIQLLKNDNVVDEKRPHTVICTTVDTLKKIFKCISANKLNTPS